VKIQRGDVRKLEQEGTSEKKKKTKIVATIKDNFFCKWKVSTLKKKKI